MTSLLDNIDSSTTRDTETVPASAPTESGFLGYVKRVRKEHPILFYTLIVAIITVIVIAIVLIIKRCKGESSEKQTKSDTDQKETFFATDSFSDEYDYINKYMEASMGKSVDPLGGKNLVEHK